MESKTDQTLKKRNAALKKELALKNRELQIEAALERVRARTMAMHKSEELVEVAAVLYQQLDHLHIPHLMAGYVLVDEANKKQEGWMTDPDGNRLDKFYLPLVGDKVMEERYEHWKQQTPVFQQLVRGKKLRKHLEFVLSQPVESSEAEDVARNRMPEQVVFYCCNFSQGYLHIHTESPLSPEHESVLVRLTQAFSMTYTRFLDLQKAEAQAREAQIEAALERVRAKTMGMHSSNELLEIVDLLYAELSHLDVELARVVLLTVDPETLGMYWWMASPEKEIKTHGFLVPHNDLPMTLSMIEAWKEKRSDWSYHLKGADKKKYDRILFSESELSQLPEEVKMAMSSARQMHISGYCNNFGLLTTSTLAPLSSTNTNLLARFGQVFEQTYTRFLDLQKAEAQAREAQIEAALERVRARSLAMHESHEVADAASEIYIQLKALGIVPNVCAFIIIDKITESGDIWMTDFDGNVLPDFGHIPTFRGEPYFEGIMSNWKKGESFFRYSLEGKELRDHDKWAAENTTIPLDRAYKVSQKERQEQLSFLVSYFNSGYFLIATKAPLPDREEEIITRFTKVFEQTYTRFLDLQKAEAQAREAKVEAALERVRARTMGMHKSDEMLEVAELLYKELSELGISSMTSGVTLIDKDDKMDSYYVVSPEDGSILKKPMGIPRDETKVMRSLTEGWEKQEPYHLISLNEKETIIHQTYIAENSTNFPFSAEELISFTPKRLNLQSFNFKQGFLILVGADKLSEEKIKTTIRFAKAFEQTYTRFLDLKKAEAQAREAEIQLALERIRARSMAMQSSEELREVVQVMYDQVDKLGISKWGCFIMIFDEGKQKIQGWLADLINAQYAKSFDFKKKDNKIVRKWWNFWKSDEDHLSIYLKDKEKFEFDSYVFENTGLGELPEEVKAAIIADHEVWVDYINMDCGMIEFIDTKPFPAESIPILKRITGVFEQAYTRFLDLQKAEAQARESEIQLALERVRARSMAMHTSEELAEVAAVLYDQLDNLHIPHLMSGYVLMDEANKHQDVWLTDMQGNRLPKSGLPLRGDEVLEERYESWKQKVPVFYQLLKGAKLKKHLEYVLSKQTLSSEAVDIVVNQFPQQIVFYCCNFSHGYLHIHTENLLSHEQESVLGRLTQAFSMSYTRFLDLQKAEAQAREAQIEAALERVRSRTMAMQKSDELTDVAGLLFKQVTEMGIKVWTAGFNIWSDDNNYYTDYITSPQGGFIKPYTIDTKQNPVLKEVSDARKSGVDFFVQYAEGEELKQMYLALTKFGDEKQYEIMLRDGFEYPSHQYHHFVFGSKVSLMFVSYEAVPEAHDIFKRFGKVFEQTYIRFLDLQKAEAQAREAQIEAALERVRSRSMAMQHSSELNIILAKVFDELRSLELEFERCVIWIYHPENKSVHWWAANPEAESGTDSYLITNQDHPVYLEYWKSWEQRRTKYLYILEGENMESWCDVLFNEMELGRLPQEVQDAMRQPDRVYLYNTFNDFGVLFIACLEPMRDDKFLILERFGKVFDQSYTRFNDIMQAEAREKEAIKQSSLDRVRAEIASMRTARDLERITPLIWKELLTLNVPFIRCGVFIMDEEEQLIHTFLSTPDGKAIAAFHIPYNTPGHIANVLQNWKEGKNYIDHWDENAFTEFAHTLVDQGALSSPEEYLKTLPPGGFYLHFLPFLQGMFYVGNTTQLSDEAINLIQSVADAFSTAYARYEDFNKLEAAKRQVDHTLNELQATQKQLIQSEKMASLGELTAGIAHEIQNPLNFVNNFSEVNTELIKELKEEVKNGNLEEVSVIADDIETNSEKINHHGKRADAIVKGMLQHSRTSTGVKEPTDINALADEYLRLSYHGLRAKDKNFNAEIKTDLDESIDKINIIPQDIGRVLLNLFNNSFYACAERSRSAVNARLNESFGQEQNASAGSAGQNYQPTVSVGTKKAGDRVTITVKDNGGGIPQKVVDKIFQPFFTTKPTGSGTGLGLSLSYDIVKAHGGEIKVDTKEGEGSEFVITLPF